MAVLDQEIEYLLMELNYFCGKKFKKLRLIFLSAHIGRSVSLFFRADIVT
jgi:hypothetical protein